MPTTVLTRKGQVTIPAEYREALGLRRGDRLEAVLDGTAVRLVRVERVAARTAGVLGGPAPARSAKALREAAEEAIAEDVTARSRPHPHGAKPRRRR